MTRSEEIDQIIEENLENIERWLRDGLTQEQVAENLGISPRTFYRRRDKKDSPLGQIVKKSRQAAVLTLENVMYKSACGYEQTVKKYQKLKRCTYNENGKKENEWEEMVEYEDTIFFPPDMTAAIFLLKNWGRYMNEPVALDLRKKELELKEKQIKENIW